MVYIFVNETKSHLTFFEFMQQFHTEANINGFSSCKCCIHVICQLAKYVSVEARLKIHNLEINFPHAKFICYMPFSITRRYANECAFFYPVLSVSLQHLNNQLELLLYETIHKCIASTRR